MLFRVAIDRKTCGGKPHIRGTRIYIAIILDALTQGLTPQEIVDHYPCLEADDIHAAVAYAVRLAEQNFGVALVGGQNTNRLFQLR